MLNWVEHEKSFITKRQVQPAQLQRAAGILKIVSTKNSNFTF